MIKKQLYFLFICFLSIGLNAQTITLKGTVENSLQQPLTYANVIAKPTDSLKALKELAGKKAYIYIETDKYDPNYYRE